MAETATAAAVLGLLKGMNGAAVADRKDEAADGNGGFDWLSNIPLLLPLLLLCNGFERVAVAVVLALFVNVNDADGVVVLAEVVVENERLLPDVTATVDDDGSLEVGKVLVVVAVVQKKGGSSCRR